MQAILNQEDREFTSSKGNWIGDIAWYPGPLWGKSGYIGCTPPDYPLTKTISLKYPYIKPATGKLNTLSFWAHFNGQSPNGLNFRWGIADGTYDYNNWVAQPYGGNRWWYFYVDPTLPSDWSLVGSEIYVLMSKDDPLVGEIHFDDFSLTYESAKLQYLPIMGIG